MYDKMLEILNADEDWDGDDCSVTHLDCGTRIEPDAPKCPECGEINPIIAGGLI